nr:MAG TPA: hypothetical protein [Bacteriophage sp.]
MTVCSYKDISFRCKMLIIYFYIVRIQPYYPLLYYYLTIHYSL